VSVKVQQLSIKVAAQEGARGFDPETLIAIFHRWISERRLPHWLLIDVADYRHVHEGPGVMIIAHQCHFGLDRGGGRLGLLFSRKRDEPGQAEEKLREALRDAFTVCCHLEAEQVPLRFRSGDLEIRVMSRLWAPQGSASFLALKPAVEAVAAELYSGGVELRHLDDPAAPLGVHLTASGPAPALTDLVGRLGGEPKL
jgi:hypothetical protein